MTEPTPALYEIDSNWRIVRASDSFSRALRCTAQGLIGRDVRDLVRQDWRADFQSYVSKALVGVGEYDATVPLVAPCGQQGWFKHRLEPITEKGLLKGCRVTVMLQSERRRMLKLWWPWRKGTPQRVWDFDSGKMAS